MAHYTPSMSPEAVAEKTGKDWDEWFAILDVWGASEKGHKETAKYLQAEHEVSGWWAQSITVEYERARGLREVGQRSTGAYSLSVQRTVAADVETAKSAWSDGRRRARWLEDEVLAPAVQQGMKGKRTSKTAMGDTVRIDVVPDGAEKKQTVEITFTDKGDKTVVRLQHEGIRDKPERDALKARWGPQFDRMKRLLDASD